MPITTAGGTTDVEFIGSWFAIELDNGITGFFKEATGLGVDIAVVEITDSQGDTTTRKRPGQVNYGEITLKRTLSKDKAFYDWAKKIRDGDKEYRTDGAIVLMDISTTEIGRWTFTNAWPSKWSASDLDVGTDDPMIEEVTLAIEHLQRES
jgi:phage tail-like protein